MVLPNVLRCCLARHLTRSRLDPVESSLRSSVGRLCLLCSLAALECRASVVSPSYPFLASLGVVPSSPKKCSLRSDLILALLGDLSSLPSPDSRFT